MLSKQMVFCMECGRPHEVVLATAPWGAKVCSKECNEGLQWKATLSMMGQPYRQREDVFIPKRENTDGSPQKKTP